MEEIASAMQHAYACWKGGERTVAAGTGGRVCTIGWGWEHWTQKDKMPKASASEGERVNAPSARVLRPHHSRLASLFLLAAGVFRFGLFYVDLRMPSRDRGVHGEKNSKDYTNQCCSIISSV